MRFVSAELEAIYDSVLDVDQQILLYADILKARGGTYEHIRDAAMELYDRHVDIRCSVAELIQMEILENSDPLPLDADADGNDENQKSDNHGKDPYCVDSTL